MYDMRHGSPYDRGRTDSYYRRHYNPHYYKGGTYTSKLVSLEDMTVEEIVAYTAGYRDNEASQNCKEYE